MRGLLLFSGMTGCVLSSAPVENGDPVDAASANDSVADAAAAPPIVSGGIAEVTGDWVAVSFPRAFVSPIVIATPGYDAGAPPLVARVRNVTGDGFELRVDRIDGAAEAVAPVKVCYLVVEEGRYEAAIDGVTMEAVKTTSLVTDTNLSWLGMSRGYANAYAAPVVLGQVMSANDSWSAFWARGDLATDPPSPTVLFVGKHVGADPTATRADEIVGYLVIEAGAAEIDGVSLVAGVTADIVGGVENMPPYPQAIDGLAGPPTAAILGMAGMDGSDGAWPIFFGPDPISETALQLATDEDQLVDVERGHTAEQVAYLAFAPAP